MMIRNVKIYEYAVVAATTECCVKCQPAAAASAKQSRPVSLVPVYLWLSAIRHGAGPVPCCCLTNQHLPSVGVVTLMYQNSGANSTQAIPIPNRQACFQTTTLP
jgi:hypothetical protein